jgi:uncharacterized protein (TIGR03790 family)
MVATICVRLCWADGQSHAPSVDSGLNGKDIAVIVNDRDPLSKQVAEYYQEKRQIPQNQIIRIRIDPKRAKLSQIEFTLIKKQVDRHTPKHVQAYVLTWMKPYKVDCMSITTAFAAGYDEAFCAEGCRKTRHNPYFDSVSKHPYNDFGWRPAMMLAGDNFADVKALIDRGVNSDYSNPTGSGYLLNTSDERRSSRARYFSEAVHATEKKFPLSIVHADLIEDKKDVMFYFTGLKSVDKLNTNHYLPGAIADHLTSLGGVLDGRQQMSIMQWIKAGVTASYGAVVEPCNFPEKFPKPKVLLHFYLEGNSLIEAYWKSVEEPGQGVFVGEPLAKPFADPKR